MHIPRVVAKLPLKILDYTLKLSRVLLSAFNSFCPSVQAAGLLSSLRLSLQLRTFPSGIKVVTTDSHSVDWICRVVADFVQSEGLGPPLTSTSLAASLLIPVSVASEYLLTAEEQCILCRDDGREGLRYFRNFFPECLYH